MTEIALNQARALYSEIPSRDDLSTMRNVMTAAPELLRVLSSPVTKKKQKKALVDKIAERFSFSDKEKNFILELVLTGDIVEFSDIMSCYDYIFCLHNNIIDAECVFPEEPCEAEKDKALKYLENRYPDHKISISVSVDPSIIGGRVIRTRGVEYDQSISGRLEMLEKRLLQEV